MRKEHVDYTLSTMFLLPMININEGWYSTFVNTKFTVDDEIIMICKSAENVINNHLIRTFIKDDLYYYVFKVPEHFRKDFELFKESKYSEFSNDLKAKILTIKGNESEECSVVFKYESRKKWLEDKIGVELKSNAELLSAVDFYKEVEVL